jgi:mannose-6-phosphate isomerase-like protein (cupin superfamily)
VLLSIIPSGSSTGLHKHDTSDEIMYVVMGKGIATEIINDKEIKDQVMPGDIIFATKNIMHKIENTGDTSMELFCVYIPSLPATGNILEAINKAKEYFEEKNKKILSGR